MDRASPGDRSEVGEDQDDVSAPLERPLWGVTLKLVSSLNFALMAASVKGAASHVASPLIVLMRGAVMVAVLFPYLRYRGVRLRCEHRGLLTARCFFGALALHLYYFAIQRAPLADVVVLANTSPLLVPLLGVMLLGERPRLVPFLSIQLLGFVGVVFIAGPRLASLDAGISAALLTGFSVAFGIIFLKKLVGREHPLTVVFHFAVWTLITPLFLPWTWNASWDGVERAWWLLILVGMFSIGGQIFLTRALHFAPAAVIALLNYFGVLLTFVFGWAIWDEEPTSAKLIGAVLIMASSALTAGMGGRLMRRSS